RSAKLAGSKAVTFGQESRRKLVQGINIVADAVKVTLGPKGRNAVLGKSYGAPDIVNDGVTIAREISLSDPEMDAGVKLVQEVASKSDNNAGDGTTTSTLMTQEIVNQGMKVVAAGANPVCLRNGISIAARRLSKEIRALAIPVKSNADVLNIATIASNSPRMGAMLAEIFDKLGESGAAVVEESQSLNDEIEFTEGLTIDRGYLSPYFVKDQERQLCELQNAYVLITDKKISSLQELLPLLEQLISSKKSLFIIADDVSGEALSTLVVNKLRGIIDVVAIRAPGFGERRKGYLRDISAATGAKYVSEELGRTLESVRVEDLGSVDRVVVGKSSSTLVTSTKYKDIIEERIRQLRKESDLTENKYEKEQLTERAASLGGGIARLKVGAATETELKDKKLRYEDALNSIRSALESGVVPGGGATMMYLSSDNKLRESIMTECNNEDEKLGVDILFKSLSAPMFQIAVNAGMAGAVVSEQCRNKEFGFGYNAATGKYEDLRTAGVVDPAKVTINAIENAASVAGLVLTTEVLITDAIDGRKEL
ncbi:unnamed protein product, partial [Ectocarpus fasciculatus]